METSSRALKVKKRRLVLGPAAWREGERAVEWDRYEGGSGERIQACRKKEEAAK